MKQFVSICLSDSRLTCFQGAIQELKLINNPSAAEDQCEEGLDQDFGSGTDLLPEGSGSGDHIRVPIPVSYFHLLLYLRGNNRNSMESVFFSFSNSLNKSAWPHAIFTAKTFKWTQSVADPGFPV